jgi:hypothetical protein
MFNRLPKKSKIHTKLKLSSSLLKVVDENYIKFQDDNHAEVGFEILKSQLVFIENLYKKCFTSLNGKNSQEEGYVPNDLLFLRQEQERIKDLIKVCQKGL